MEIINKNFFSQDTVLVAKELLGKVLVKKDGREIIRSLIVETEAYHGEADLACHASKGRTMRTETMYGDPGLVYVYLIYGMYFCLNIVTMEKNFPAAVLIRSVFPLAGINKIIKNRRKIGLDYAKKLDLIQIGNLTDGPGKLCQGLKIDKKLNSKRLGRKNNLWIEGWGINLSSKQIVKSKRINVAYAQHCADWKWNFKIKKSALLLLVKRFKKIITI